MMSGVTSSKQEQLTRAIQFAFDAHRGQTRKVDGQPYIFHPIAVARLLMEIGCDQDVVIAGLLHDTVEDTDVTLAQVEGEFGQVVAGWVGQLTEPDKAKPWQERKQAYLQGLSTAEPEVLLISLADKLDNLRSLRMAIDRQADLVWEKFNSLKAEQCWYYTQLIAIYSNRIRDLDGREMLGALQQDFSIVFDQ